MTITFSLTYTIITGRCSSLVSPCHSPEQWSPSVRSKTLRDVLDETLPNFQDEANDYSEGEWFKMMHDTAEYASCGKS